MRYKLGLVSMDLTTAPKVDPHPETGLAARDLDGLRF